MTSVVSVESLLGLLGIIIILKDKLLLLVLGAKDMNKEAT